MGVSENRGKTTQIIHFDRGFHEINHPFWGGKIPLFLVQHPYIPVPWEFVMGWNMHHHAPPSSPQGWLQLSSHPQGWPNDQFLSRFKWGFTNGGLLTYQYMIEMIYMEIVYEIYECECLPYFFSMCLLGELFQLLALVFKNGGLYLHLSLENPIPLCWLIRRDSKAMADFRIPVNKANTK